MKFKKQTNSLKNKKQTHLYTFQHVCFSKKGKVFISNYTLTYLSGEAPQTGHLSFGIPNSMCPQTGHK